MRFAPTRIDEQEVTIQLDRKAGLARISSTWPDLAKRLMKRYGPPKDVTKDKKGRITSAFWEVEASLVRFASPRKTRPPTEAQLRARKALADRMRNAHFAGKAP